MNILVTGCAGFIGWKVSELLLEQGHTVIGIDNINNAYDARLKSWRLEQLQGHPNFSFHQLDITDRKALVSFFSSKFEIRNSKLDAMINLAARAGVRQSVEDPWVYYETNVTGTLNLLELCREFKVKKFVLASTSSLYGANNTRPFREDANTDGPLSPYAASKKAAEALCYTYHYLHGLDVTVLRYFTVYGPAGRPDMSIFRFIKWIAEGDPVIVYGDGTQERDFTYVEDIARGTILGLKPLGYEVVNLGSDHPVPLKTVVAHLEDILGKSARIERQPLHAADVPATWADVSRAKRLLDWTPQTTLEEGLQAAVAWYQTNRQWAREIQLGS
ncbi:MAG: SDR family NAD(P)-dependent oxidoreductase [Candidatus Binatia bacterium]